MEREEVIKTIKSFGLSGYEAAAYATLLTLGVSKASDVCKDAGIPQSKIYEVLDSLVGKHLVEISEGRPKKFRALPPAVGLKRLIEEKEESLKRLKDKLAEIDASIKALAAYDVIEGVWAAKEKGLKDFIDRLCEMYTRSKQYTCVITRDFTWTPKLVETINACIKRGVEVRAIAMKDIDSDNYHRAKYFHEHGAKIRIYKTKVHPRIAVMDGMEVLIRLDQDPNKPRDFRFTSLYSADPSLVTIFDKYMKNLWSMAKPIDFDAVAKKLGIED
jgi:sugar-specific transcriptional regulator TrmB